MSTVRILLISICLLSTQFIFGQDNGNKKATLEASNSIERFKNTEFMTRFNELKLQVEGEASDFLAQRNKYKPAEVRQVQMAYERTVTRFNQFLTDLKQDFLNRDKIKMINKYPDTYSNGLKSKITDLDRFYRENLMVAVSSVTKKDGSNIIEILVKLIEESGKLSTYFTDLKFDKTAMTEDYLKQNLIDPMRLKSWQTILNETPANSN